MKFETFEDILSWQKAKELTRLAYELTEEMKDFVFKDQLRRASVSIMNNIAEGFERGSNKDFSKFLFIAKGSCGEVRSMLDFALALNYISENGKNRAYEISVEISKLLSGLIKSIN